MKYILLLLSALIVMPAWAGDVAPTAKTGVVIKLKGSAKNVSALVAELEKEAAYTEASCTTGKKPGKTAKITCAKADGTLMTFLGNYAAAKVQWTVSGTTVAVASSATADNPVAARAAAICPAMCTMMNCPPPGGPVMCCKRTTVGYRPC